MTSLPNQQPPPTQGYEIFPSTTLHSCCAVLQPHHICRLFPLLSPHHTQYPYTSHVIPNSTSNHFSMHPHSNQQHRSAMDKSLPQQCTSSQSSGRHSSERLTQNADTLHDRLGPSPSIHNLHSPQLAPQLPLVRPPFRPHPNSPSQPPSL